VDTFPAIVSVLPSNLLDVFQHNTGAVRRTHPFPARHHRRNAKQKPKNEARVDVCGNTGAWSQRDGGVEFWQLATRLRKSQVSASSLVG
jgi:hypothetical protein